jgi:hypothetical protein
LDRKFETRNEYLSEAELPTELHADLIKMFIGGGYDNAVRWHTCSNTAPHYLYCSLL